MQISQIYLSDSDAPLPPHLSQCVALAKTLAPDLAHVLYDKDSLRGFIAATFDAEVVAAYDKLNPYAYRCDLGRYCLLYAIGGWYLDVSVRVVTAPLAITADVETIAFRDIQINSGTCWACLNSVLYARPRQPVFQTAIQMVVENCRKQYYGITPLCPTGPTLLGRAFAIHGASRATVFGDFQILTPYRSKMNPAFVLPDGTLLAFGKMGKGGDLSELGAKGTNNYNDFYFAGNVSKTS